MPLRPDFDLDRTNLRPYRIEAIDSSWTQESAICDQGDLKSATLVILSHCLTKKI